LPKWIFNNLRLPTQRPQVNVVAFAVVVASLIPVYVAQRLTRETGLTGGLRRRTALGAGEPAGDQMSLGG